MNNTSANPKSVWLRPRLFSLIAFIFASAEAYAEDLSNEFVGNRISLAQDRILIFTDAVARQASGAYPIGSSVNPAADDFLRTAPADYRGYGLLISSDIAFEENAWISGGAISGGLR